MALFASPPRSPSVSCLTVKEVAHTLAVSDQTVRRLIDSGELPAFRIRGVVRVTAEALDAFVARSST